MLTFPSSFGTVRQSHSFAAMSCNGWLEFDATSFIRDVSTRADSPVTSRCPQAWTNNPTPLPQYIVLYPLSSPLPSPRLPEAPCTTESCESHAAYRFRLSR